MRRSSFKARMGAAAGVLVALTALVLPVTATAAAGATADDTGRQCQIVLGEAPAPGHASPVLEQECAESGEQLTAPAERKLLVILYEHINYNAGPNGGASYRIYGFDGPCDASGYGIRDFAGFGWGDRVSSYKVFNNCTYSAVFEHADYGGVCDEFRGDVPWVGTGINDQISSMWVSSDASGAWSHCD